MMTALSSITNSLGSTKALIVWMIATASSAVLNLTPPSSDILEIDWITIGQVTVKGQSVITLCLFVISILVGGIQIYKHVKKKND